MQSARTIAILIVVLTASLIEPLCTMALCMPNASRMQITQEHDCCSHDSDEHSTDATQISSQSHNTCQCTPASPAEINTPLALLDSVTVAPCEASVSALESTAPAIAVAHQSLKAPPPEDRHPLLCIFLI